MTSADENYAAALDWLDRMDVDEPVRAGALAPADPEDWLGIGQTLESDPQQIRDRLAIEASLRQLTNRIYASTIDEIMLFFYEDLPALFGVERVLLFVIDRVKQEVFSKIKLKDGVHQVHLPIGASSLPGFVAATGRILSIADAYDTLELRALGKDLKLDRDCEKRWKTPTRQVLAAPIKTGHHTEGVVQLVNHQGGKPFGARHKRLLLEIAETLAVAFINLRKVRSRSRFDRLFSMCLVSEEMIDKANELAREEGGSIESYLATSFSVPKKEILASLSEYYRVEDVALSADTPPPPPELLRPFGRVFLEENACIPIAQEGGDVILATASPKDVVVIDEVARRLDKRVRGRVALREEVLAFIARVVPEGATGIPKPLADLSSTIEQLDFETPAEQSPADEQVDVKDSSTGMVRLVNQIIEGAYERGVSDIHVEPYPDEDVVIRFRIDGVCQVYSTVPRRFARALTSRIKIMSDLDISERRLPQDGKISFKKFGKLDIELRVATLPTAGGLEDCVMRILTASKPMPLDDMGFLPANLAGFKHAVSQPYGLVLVVGPTGSGKTTTLHSALGHINTPMRKIWTAEDPVEITQKGLRQVQIHPKIGFTFAKALRAFLRADPDVIMIGEMRDRETAEAGVEASLTGHLVFSTLHTNSAPETVTRLLDMGLDPYSFGDSLLGVLAQRLIRRLCTSCKTSYPATPRHIAAFKAEFGDAATWDALGVGKGATLYQGKGCNQCGNTGYRGRMGIHEFMPGSLGVSNVIYRNGSIADLRAAAADDGMTTLKQDGLRKVLAGHSDLLEVRRVCIQKGASEQAAPLGVDLAAEQSVRLKAARQTSRPKPAKKKAAKKKATKKKAVKKKATKKKAVKKKAKRRG